jgi:glycosyltransferase involved in cell wall biosynthesis
VILTVGLPCYKAYPEAALTLQALRLYHDLDGVELLVVDNAGDRALERLAGRAGARYVREEVPGPSHAKNRVFREARGEWTLCIDSHVLLAPGALTALRCYAIQHPDSIDLLHGPMLYDELRACADAMEPRWGTDKHFGVWRTRATPPEGAPYEIPMHGCGLFACRSRIWPGFPLDWRGVANEEGYIHERFRRFGGKILCHPSLRWWHLFRQAEHPAPHAPRVADLARNFLIAYRDLGWDPAPVLERFPGARI